MQITDILQQLNRQTLSVQGEKPAFESTALSAKTGIEELLGLKEGQIFEGTITQVQENKVSISLANGSNIQARLEEGITLTKGKATFFQVKSNVDGQIALKTVTQDKSFNPTLLKALDAASVKVTDRTLQLVQSMMKQQLPIDSKNLVGMARTAYLFPETSVETLTQLEKLKLPINEQTIEQIEHYQKGEGKVQSGLEQIIKELPSFIGKELDGRETIEFLKSFVPELEESIQMEEHLQKEEIPMTKDNALPGVLQEAGMTADEVKVKAEIKEGTLLEEIIYQEETDEKPEANLKNEKTTLEILEKNFGSSESKTEPLEQLKGLLKSIDENLFSQKEMKEIFSSKEFQKLMQRVFEKQWFLEPEVMKEKEEIKQLYQKIDRQLEKLEAMLQDAGKSENPVGKQITEVRNNISFMNEVNQIYNYVQIPLKMANQNATGELFVYTNKKSVNKKGGDLSAHLHLEMEHLGVTDVFVRLAGKKLSTNFKLEDEKALALVIDHVPMLTERLTKKGYEVDVQVKESGKDVENKDFADKLLGEESAKGLVSRYSFDVKV